MATEKKKMPIIDYLPAQLKHNSHGWYIEYQVIDPVTGKMKRYWIRMNALRKRYTLLSEFKAHCNKVICNINAKLAGGWNPIGENQNTRLYTPIPMVVNDYLAEKEAELRPDTIRSYRSFCSGFIKWLDQTAPNCQAVLFNKVLAVKFLDHCFKDRKLTGRSWNNQLKAARALFTWALEKCYCKENPFSGIKTKLEAEKRRILIPSNTRKRITDWCQENNPGLMIVCQLVYSSLIRPKEIRCIHVGDIYLNEHYIYIGSKTAKTHYTRFAALNPCLETMISEWIKGSKQEYYLIGSIDYHAGPKPLPHSRFSKDWIKMRKDLNLPETMQLYSLRDTGINEMLKSGIDPLTVMQHADHHDLSMTTRYANHADPNLVDTISKRAPEF